MRLFHLYGPLQLSVCVLKTSFYHHQQQREKVVQFSPECMFPKWSGVVRAIHHHVTSPSLFILTALRRLLAVVAFPLRCVDLKNITQVSPTPAQERHQAGEKKQQQSKKSLFHVTFFYVFILLVASLYLLLYIFWANPFNERLCPCIPMSRAARDQEFLIAGRAIWIRGTCSFFKIAKSIIFGSLRLARVSALISRPPFKKRNSFRVFSWENKQFLIVRWRSMLGMCVWVWCARRDSSVSCYSFTQNVTSQQVVLLCKKYRFLLLVALYIMFVSCSSTQPSSSRRYIHGAFFLNTTWTQRESVCSMLSGKL